MFVKGRGICISGQIVRNVGCAVGMGICFAHPICNAPRKYEDMEALRKHEDMHTICIDQSLNSGNMIMF